MTIRDAVLAVAIVLGISNMMMLLSFGPHKPDDPGSGVFMKRCHEMNFTQEQCDFFRYGPDGPGAPQ